MQTGKIDFYIVKGKKDINWFRDCENTFVDIFGREKLNLVASLFAATSINTSLKSNITLFRKAFYEIQNNLPVGNYMPVMKLQIERIRNGEDIRGRKILSFRNAMCGDVNAVVVDTWLARAFEVDKKYFRQKGGVSKGRGTMRSAGVADKTYTMIEDFVKSKAVELNLEARQVSSMIWAGVRMATNNDTETHYKDLLKAKFINLFNVI